MLEKLPNKVRGVLESLLKGLESRELVSGIGLFGSWSRGDAVTSSDVDLLIVDSRDFEYEYVERAEIEEVAFDLNYVPETWLLKRVPSEADQKLFEVQVLFDRKGALTQAKNLASQNHWQPERVEIRTGDYLMEADTYLSRGLSAYNKGDFQSAKVNASIGFDAIMKILIEINRTPISNSHFVRAVESATKRLGMSGLFGDYIEVLGLSKLSKRSAEGLVVSLLEMWGEAIAFVDSNSMTVKDLHVRVMHDLDYYCRRSFLRGLSARAAQLINNGFMAEAAHYLFRTSVSMLENLVWLLLVLDGRRFDYTDLFAQLKGSTLSPGEVYQKSAATMRVEEVSSNDVEAALRRIKEVSLELRQRRKQLIAGMHSETFL